MRITAKSKIVDEIAEQVAPQFPGFGSGRKSPWGNPMAGAFASSGAVFALGVPVRDVVLATLKAYEKSKETANG